MWREEERKSEQQRQRDLMTDKENEKIDVLKGRKWWRVVELEGGKEGKK